MMRNWLVGGLLFLVFMVSVSVTLWTDVRHSEENEIMKMNDLEAEIVRIEVDGRRFNVPMRYLYGEAIEKYQQWPTSKKNRVRVDALTLSVLLPDLRPYYSEDDARWKTLGHGDRLEVSVMKPAGGTNWYNFIRRRIDDEVNKGLSSVSKDAYGLTQFLTPLGPRYFPIERSSELTISCVGAHRVEPKMSPSCKVKSRYLNGIVLEYYFGIDHLPSWREIDRDIKDMFDRFERAAAKDHQGKD